jgi:hypothetical protein
MKNNAKRIAIRRDIVSFKKQHQSVTPWQATPSLEEYFT